MFSPYYARARRQGRGEAENYCSINVALYGPGANRWAMTERGAGAVHRDVNTFSVGPSSLSWDGTSLVIDTSEITVPIPRRLRGTIRIHPGAVNDHTALLDPDGHHRWRPLAPSSRIEVAFEKPAVAWSGMGYLDSNEGDVPLEDSFQSWNWSRSHLRRDAAILYDVTHKSVGRQSLALRIDPSGKITEETPPAVSPLRPGALWRMPRGTRADGESRIVKTLEDTPFYTRSLLSTSVFGEQTTAVHESLSLRRFCHPLVQLMLPFRMPRRRG